MTGPDTRADPVLIRPLVPDDAPKLARCFERCYGSSYVADFFYDPDRVRARIAGGLLRSVVAVDSSGDIVGHMGLTLRRPGALTADAGNTIVDPRFRNRGLAARLGAGIFELCLQAALVGFHHYPTTAHPIMQRLAVRGGGIETGVMLGYIPAGTRYRELADDASGLRRAVVVVYQPLAPAPPREAVVPERYAAILEACWRRAGLERSPLQAADTLPATPGHMEIVSDARRGLLRFEVERAGADLPDRVAGASPQDVDLIHVDLLLSDPGVSMAVEALRSLGFTFCALLPEYRDGDVLRLQRLAGVREGSVLPELATPPGRELLDFIVRDSEPAG